MNNKYGIALRFMTAVILFYSSFSLYAQEPRAEAPTYKVGDRWFIRYFDETEQKNFEETTIIREVTPDQIKWQHGLKTITYRLTTHSGQTKARFSANEAMTIAFEPYDPYIEFPLHTGKEWSKDFSLTEASTDQRKGNASGKVVSYEKKTTKAGTFDTFKVELKYNSRGVSSRGNSYHAYEVITYWYSPEIKRVIEQESVRFIDGRQHSKRRFTLESFSLNN